MKTIKNLLSILVIFTSLTFVSCDDEPVDPTLLNTANNPSSGGGTPSTTVVGTYKLTAFNTSVSTDLNNDGTSSTNQLSETTCFNNSFLTLNANNTFSADSKGVEIDLGTNTLDCFTDPVTIGTWAVSGSTLTTTYVDSGTTYTETYTISGNTLTYSLNGGEIVGTAGGNPVYLTSNIQIIYTKQ
ncbi:MAG: lipocalin family protein [Bacteroidota bacterium]